MRPERQVGAGRRRADRRRRVRRPMSRRSRWPARRWPRSACRICRSTSPCRPWCRRLPRPMASPASARRRLRAALDHKDVAAVAAVAGEAGELLGVAGRGGRAGRSGAAPRSTGSICRRGRAPSATGSARCSTGSTAAIPELKVTVDPVENRGFEYHTGISFTFFARVDPALGPGRRTRPRRPLSRPATRPRPSRRPASRSTPTRSCAHCRSRRRAAALCVPFGADRARAPRAARGGAGSPSRRCEPAADWRGRGAPPRLRPCARGRRGRVRGRT